MNVLYPSGRPITVGDRIWFDEGMAVGYIKGFYTGEDGVMTAMVDLFPSTAAISVIVGLSLSCFEDEGIAPLSEAESSEVEKVFRRVIKEKSYNGAMCAVFRIFAGKGSFPYAIVEYSLDREVRSCCTLSHNPDAEIHNLDPSQLPLIAFPVRGGGRSDEVPG